MNGCEGNEILGVGYESGDIPAVAADAVLVKSEKLTSDTIVGYNFSKGIDYEALLDSYLRTGFQATNFGMAVEQINRMLDWSLADEPVAEDEEDEYKEKEKREKVRTKIWLSYTSNLISCGLRETICYLAKNSMIQVMITTAGGIEEDIIKCLAPTHVGDFAIQGLGLRRKGINRTGNLLVPNDNYCLFEDWFQPILDKMHDEQDKDRVAWTPSRLIHRMGKEIDNEESVCYWAYKNNIPVFSPAITDGSIGDMLYFHSYKRPGLIIDIVSDIRAVNDEAVKSRKTGVIVLGGGLVKHHCMNANLMRNGADFCVYVNTAQEFDGSDSGARPDEAISWGKIRIDAKPVKIYAEATLVAPLLVAKTFARKVQEGKWNPDGRIFNKSHTAAEAEIEKQKVSGTPPQ
jgi:deoxyhypusine synthase|mmetsp:Transcript_88803/g.138997  ORF Transcript_88803/g.138997 Transcript_88803/m.138997 type:complete len:403 (+) Transcript_88803:116-1324(+)